MRQRLKSLEIMVVVLAGLLLGYITIKAISEGRLAMGLLYILLGAAMLWAVKARDK